MTTIRIPSSGVVATRTVTVMGVMATVTAPPVAPSAR